MFSTGCFFQLQDDDGSTENKRIFHKKMLKDRFCLKNSGIHENLRHLFVLSFFKQI